MVTLRFGGNTYQNVSARNPQQEMTIEAAKGLGLFKKHEVVQNDALPALTALTGVEEPIFSIWKDNGVAAGYNVQLIKKQGVWWLDDVDSCAGLTS